MNIWSRLKVLLPWHRRAAERDMREELEALRGIAGPHELGNLTLAAEDARAAWTWIWLEQLGQDLRYAWRSMAHQRTFTAMAVLSLALGIGANTAIYSFTESILLRSLPVPDPDSVVIMKWRAKRGYSSAASSGFSMSTEGTHRQGDGILATQFPYPALEVFEKDRRILSSAFCYFVVDRLNLTVHGQTEVVRGQYVSGDYFRGMAVVPEAGRSLLPADDQVGAETVVMLSHRYGQRRFGDAAQAVGQTVRINDRPFLVVGVTPSGFFGAEPGTMPDVYVPLQAKMVIDSTGVATGTAARQRDYYFLDANYYWIEIMGRLAPGVDRAQAEAALAPQFHQFVEATASTEAQRADLPELIVAPGGAGLDSMRRRYGQQVHVLMTMVGLILLIACANLANLLLARATARRREIAVRLSIGAGRSRIIRQMLTESILLSSIGGILGLAFAWWGIRVITALLANGRENFTLHAELNWHVLGVTLLLAVITGALFGLAPARQATRIDVIPALQQVRTAGAGGAGQGRRRLGLHQGLVVVQIALSLVLLVAAGLFGGTLSNLHAIQLGFDRDDLLLFTIRPRAAGYQGPALARLYEGLRQQLREVPGVLDVSLSSRPLPTGGGTTVRVTAAGSPLPAPESPQPDAAGLLSVGPDFFKTMRIPMKAGREFSERDLAGAPPVAIINEKLAAGLGLANPVGSRIGFGDKNTYEVVGVVGDALFLSLKDEQRPMLYLTYLQGSPPSLMTYELRTAGNPLALAGIVRGVVRALDSRLAVSDVKTQAGHVDQAINREITLARLCAGFAVLALVIACVGLYGTVAFNVSRRINEIGIRRALGARPAGVMWLFLRSVLMLELIGLAVGLPVVLWGSRYIESLLFGVAPNDPLVLAAGVVVLLTSGLAASYVPARRALAIEPMAALRNE